MKIDYAYLKKLLNIFVDVPKPTFSLLDIPWLDLSKPPDEETHRFVFHMEILSDLALIESTTRGRLSLGITRTANCDYILSITPLRLTALGHDFTTGLNKSGVFERLTATFKDVGPTEVVKAVIKLSAKAVKNRFNI